MRRLPAKAGIGPSPARVSRYLQGLALSAAAEEAGNSLGGPPPPPSRCAVG